jgi:hypothetical protein
MAENKQLEDLLTGFSKDQNKELLHKIVPILAHSHVLVPAMPPKDFDPNMMEELKQGKKMELPKGVRPVPALLQTAEMGRFLGVYTQKKHIPKEGNYPLMMDMHFVDCCRMATQLKMDGVVVNAFSQNLTFKKAAVDAFVRDFGPKKAGNQGGSAAQPIANPQKVKLTKEQFEDVTRKSIELKLLPKFIYEHGAKYIDDICEGKESLLAKMYEEPFQRVPEVPCPYTPADFSVMDLNINDELMLVRLDLPEKKLLPGSCARIYITINPQNEEIHYFTIQQGAKKEDKILGKVTKENRHIVIGEAPDDSGELQRIIDLIEFEKVQTN